MEDGAESPSHWFHSCTLLRVQPGDATLPRRWQQAEELATSHEDPETRLPPPRILPRTPCSRGQEAGHGGSPVLRSAAPRTRSPPWDFFPYPTVQPSLFNSQPHAGLQDKFVFKPKEGISPSCPKQHRVVPLNTVGVCRSQGSPAFSASSQGTVTALRAGTEGPRPPRGVVGHRQRKDDGSRSTDQLTQSRAVPRGKGRRPRSRAEDGSGDEHEGSRTPAWPRGCRASPERWHLAPSSCT